MFFRTIRQKKPSQHSTHIKIKTFMEPSMGKLELIHHSAAKSKQNAKVIASRFRPGVRRPEQKRRRFDSSMIPGCVFFFFSFKVLFAETEKKERRGFRRKLLSPGFFLFWVTKKML